ncbi:putative hydrolase [Phaeomoniella chlamydospora]|uniref:Putative hydrolase n=1 Tax=Phaeomoniella chlamydospora TaxID=158046 RepID=A0A0G2EY79_PHACM|nr:putative hydrolase [Phaeomoniella chlamydospora]
MSVLDQAVRCLNLIPDDQLAKYTGSSPSFTRSSYGRDATEGSDNHQGFGVDYGAYKSRQLDETADSYFPDAAIPPVVRMAKPKAPESVNREELVITATNGRSLRSTPSSRSLVADRIDEAIREAESPAWKGSTSATESTSALTPGSQNSDTKSSGSPGGIGSGRPIPSRQSSLRHSYSGSPAKQKRPARHSRHSMSSSKDIKVDSDLPEEEDEVVKRIKELKAAKQKRDKEFQAVTGETTRRTRQKKPLPSPVSTSRSDSRQETRRNLAHMPASEMAILEEGAPSPTISTGKRNSQRLSDPLLMSTASHGRKKSWDRSNSVKAKRNSRPSSPQRANSTKETRRNSGAMTPTRTSIGEGRPSTSDSIDDAVDAYLNAPRMNQKVRHPQSGRVIAFSEVGDPDGYAVFCCVGMGLTRFLTAFYDELARTLRLRLITPDRPGVGESEPCMDGTGTPLAWPDDVAIICNHLRITKFSLLAHSAGAIYALATALRMPQQIRGRIHLLAPWIPPSQMSSMGSNREPLPSGAVPYSQKLLRAIPTSFLKAANSSFMSATSASITSSLPRSPRKSSSKRKSTASADSPGTTNITNTPSKIANALTVEPSTVDKVNDNPAFINKTTSIETPLKYPLDSSRSTTPDHKAALEEALRIRERDYDDRLTQTIWHLATTNSNPALDLVTCLERRRPIGFRYVDITRPVVIHHGSRDTRVPVDNVRWLGRVMRRCEVRILEGQGHGLMALPSVMGDVLGEVAKEWEDWSRITGRGERGAGRSKGERIGIRERAESLVNRHY